MTSMRRLIFTLVLGALVHTEVVDAPAAVLRAGVLSRDLFNMCDGLLDPAEGSWYLLDNFGSFSLGDTVVVTAARITSRDCNDYNTYFALANNTIAPWRDFDFGCGRIFQNAEYGCRGFSSRQYGSFHLSWPGSMPPDSAHVWGTIELELCLFIPECAFGPCLMATRVEACGDSNTAITRTTWGVIKGAFR